MRLPRGSHNPSPGRPKVTSPVTVLPLIRETLAEHQNHATDQPFPPAIESYIVVGGDIVSEYNSGDEEIEFSSEENKGREPCSRKDELRAFSNRAFKDIVRAVIDKYTPSSEYVTPYVLPPWVSEIMVEYQSDWNTDSFRKSSKGLSWRDSSLPIAFMPNILPGFAPEGHVSPETEQVSSPGSASSTHLEEHDEEDFDDDDDDDDDDAAAAAAAIDTQIQASDHEEVPIETVLPPKRPANTTYDAIVASEGKIVEAENRRHSDLMTVLERMIALQEETVSQLAHLHRVFIEVPKQLQKINTSFEALVVQQTQANYWRMTNVPQFNTSQPGSVHAGQFSPH
ncbi:uncharacterized protein LOC142488100 [Ascaphus truei]|uniref:uncharacterized protein LOC142488100 n=1 Tax=Ascaphus truei TaxID=8439 RepID=UPI003F591C2F